MESRAPQNGQRLDQYLTELMPEHSRSKITAHIQKNGVLVNDLLVLKAGHKLLQSDSVELPTLDEPQIHDLTPAEIHLDIVYEDEACLVVNKPRGLASHPADSLKEPSLVNALLSRGHELSQEGGAFRPGIVHRLDKDTTGLMVVAKNDQAHRALAKQFENKTAERRYVAVIYADAIQDRILVDAPIARDKSNRQRMAVDPAGKTARTHIKVLKRNDKHCLVLCRLETGRTHQIRVHLSFAKYPVLGDKIYSPRNLQNLPLQLHAAYLAFDHPTNKQRMEFVCTPPEDFLYRDDFDAEQVITF